MQIYTSARYMSLSGEHPMESWRHLPGPRAWFPWFLLVITVICFPFLLASLSLLIGTFINWIGGIPGAEQGFYARLWSSLLIVLAALMSLRSGYGFLEVSQKIIVALLLGSIIVAAIACQPSVTGMLAGLIPSVPVYEPWVQDGFPKIAAKPVWIEVISYVGIIGAGLPAYIGYLGFLRDKQWSFFGTERICDHRTKESSATSISRKGMFPMDAPGWCRCESTWVFHSSVCSSSPPLSWSWELTFCIRGN